jgi:hypothetical protein
LQGGLNYYDSNPYGYDQAMKRLDWSIGFADELDGISIEFRREAR